jgi:hypothetical protein
MKIREIDTDQIYVSAEKFIENYESIDMVYMIREIISQYGQLIDVGMVYIRTEIDLDNLTRLVNYFFGEIGHTTNFHESAIKSFCEMNQYCKDSIR